MNVEDDWLGGCRGEVMYVAADLLGAPLGVEGGGLHGGGGLAGHGLHHDVGDGGLGGGEGGEGEQLPTEETGEEGEWGSDGETGSGESATARKTGDN